MWLWGSPIELRQSRLRRWRDRLINELVLDAFNMSRERMDAYLARIVAYRPRLIQGYSSAVAMLARHARRRHRPTDFPWLRVAVLTGDEVLPEYRREIAGVFGCRVVSEYGSREVGLIGYECARGRMHVLSPHVHVEIVRGGRRVAAGETGSIVCTNLNSRAQPLIRYALGDFGMLSTETCDCGLPLPVLEIEEARVTGFVALSGGRLCHGHLMAYLVRSDPRVVEFKVHQRALDTFEVHMVVTGAARQAVCDGVRERFRQQLGADVRVECRVVADIPPDPSGKRRHLISDVAESCEEFELVRPEGLLVRSGSDL
jgi:phenylacetate-CoA ligase